MGKMIREYRLPILVVAKFIGNDVFYSNQVKDLDSSGIQNKTFVNPKSIFQITICSIALSSQ